MMVLTRRSYLKAGVAAARLEPETRAIEIKMAAVTWAFFDEFSKDADIAVEAYIARQLEALVAERMAEAKVFSDALATSAQRPSRIAYSPHMSKTLYFMQRGTGGPIKIGVSRNVGMRQKGLQNGSAEQVHVLAQVAQSSDINEKELHKRFAHCRKKGEWFEPTPELLAFIDTLRQPADTERRQA